MTTSPWSGNPTTRRPTKIPTCLPPPLADGDILVIAGGSMGADGSMDSGGAVGGGMAVM